MNVRHDITIVENEHNWRRMLSQRKPTEKQLITTWLKRERGHYSSDIQQNRDQAGSVDDKDEGTEESNEALKQKVCLRLNEKLHAVLQAAPATDAVINSKGGKHLRTGQYNNTIPVGSLNNKVMTAFGRILDRGYNKRQRKIIALRKANRANTNRERTKGGGQVYTRPTCIPVIARRNLDTT